MTRCCNCDADLEATTQTTQADTTTEESGPDTAETGQISL